MKYYLHLFTVLFVGFMCGDLMADDASMMADSPVTFPEKGAIPSKYPPDRPSKDRSKPEEGYYLFGSPQRSLEQIETIREKMPEGEFTSPRKDHAPLSHTMKTLNEGGDLHILALGDSIVNDTMRSGWVAKLREAYPRADITATVYVRGGGGCQHYIEEDRIAKHVVPKQPDLVMIGGISQKNTDCIREAIYQLREALPEVEILLFTGTFGRVDPRSEKAVRQAPHSGAGEYGEALKTLADEENCAYLDMTTPWAEYIRTSGVHPHRFYRDRVHANAQGEQILSKILLDFWTSEKD
jgi:lysophospholipase L1-like esterase